MLAASGCGGASRTWSGDDAAPIDDTPDMAVAPLPDGATPRDMAGAKPVDMAMTTGPADMAPTPITGSVGPKGGTVSRLYFGFSGDARPSQCNETFDYPTTILNSIYTRMNGLGLQFSVDLGDHMFVCQNGTQAMATGQMNLFMSAAAKFANKPTFLTLGNHDCVSMTNPSYCKVGGFTTPNFTAFLNALAPVSSQPYYSFDVQTQSGLARFVVIADNAWSSAQQTWLTQTLADADAKAKYIFLFRHHPLDNTDMPDFQTISGIIKTVKHRTMTFTGHTHEFKLDTFNDASGRTVVIGNGGAPLTQNFTWYGFGTVEQLQNGNLAIRLIDQATGNQMGAFTISPQ